MTKLRVMLASYGLILSVLLCMVWWLRTLSTTAEASSSAELSQTEIARSLHVLLPHTDRLDERQMRVLRTAAESCELGTVGAHRTLDRDFEFACLRDAAPNQMAIIFQRAQ